MAPVRRPIAERFWPKVEKAADCWLWTGAVRMPNGYGVVRADTEDGGGNAYAHRVAYELLVGPIPEGLTIDHLCRNHLCVNPAHLEPVTERENILRGDGPAARNARKTHCTRGHELSGENVWTGNGRRECRACWKARREERR